MHKWLRTGMAVAVAALAAVGCGGSREVVVEQDPEELRMKQEMMDQFMQQQRQASQQIAPQIPASGTPQAPAEQQ